MKKGQKSVKKKKATELTTPEVIERIFPQAVVKKLKKISNLDKHPSNMIK
jgi:hypothetical protein